MPKSLPAILVVGGAGYIGSHICKELHRCGYIPVCYDNLIYGHTWAVKWAPFEKGDIKETRSGSIRFSRRIRIEGVIHLAALCLRRRILPLIRRNIIRTMSQERSHFWTP